MAGDGEETWVALTWGLHRDRDEGTLVTWERWDRKVKEEARQMG